MGGSGAWNDYLGPSTWRGLANTRGRVLCFEEGAKTNC
jgi:hypothetical protein